VITKNNRVPTTLVVFPGAEVEVGCRVVDCALTGDAFRVGVTTGGADPIFAQFTLKSNEAASVGGTILSTNRLVESTVGADDDERGRHLHAFVGTGSLGESEGGGTDDLQQISDDGFHTLGRTDSSEVVDTQDALAIVAVVELGGGIVAGQEGGRGFEGEERAGQELHSGGLTSAGAAMEVAGRGHHRGPSASHIASPRVKTHEVFDDGNDKRTEGGSGSLRGEVLGGSLAQTLEGLRVGF
jgi:hypothetical protein